jgi:ribonuclease Z
MLFREAAELAEAGKVKELLLTHFSPIMRMPELYRENAEAIFANVTIGQDRLTKGISFIDK